MDELRDTWRAFFQDFYRMKAPCFLRGYDGQSLHVQQFRPVQAEDRPSLLERAAVIRLGDFTIHKHDLTMPTHGLIS
jgi:hypothetical protein